MLDEPLARLVATREGIQQCGDGVDTQQGDRYEFRSEWLIPLLGSPCQQRIELEKKDVLVVVAKLAARVRKALGDAVPESVQLAQAETFTTRSLESGS